MDSLKVNDVASLTFAGGLKVVGPDSYLTASADSLFFIYHFYYRFLIVKLEERSGLEFTNLSISSDHNCSEWDHAKVQKVNIINILIR